MKRAINQTISPVVILVFLFMGIVACDNDNSTSSDDDSDVRSIGVMFPLTGNSPIDKTALETIMGIAVKDVNDYLKESGAQFRISAKLKDTENTPTGVTNALGYFAENDITCVVASGTSQNIYDAEHALSNFSGIVIHTTSTSATLAKDDNLYRFVSNDTITAKAIAQRIWADGKKKIVLSFRDDIWGTGFSESIKTQYEALGGTVTDTIPYNARLVPDCIPEAITSIEAKIDSVLLTTQANELALVVMAFSEIADILTQATGLDALGVSWYGSDGNLLNENILTGSPAVAENAKTTGLFSPAIKIPDSEAYTQLKAQVETQLGYSPRANNYILYDAIFAAALTIKRTEATPKEDLKTSLTNVLGENDFITGDIVLDGNGDRLNGTYDFYRVVKQDTTYFWEISGN